MEGELPKEQGTLEFNPIEKADGLVANFQYAPGIIHESQRAFYNRYDDLVNMPKRETFHTVEEYYSTLFHELGHSTGHVNRLNRKTLQEINKFGDHSYSKEELVAEMSSAFLCSIAGISDAVIDNQAAYLNGWLKELRKDSSLFIHAAQQAQKAVDHITGRPMASPSL